MKKITTFEELEQVYPRKPAPVTFKKEIDHINDHYRQFIEASPFCILATYGDKGIDCSPRGDPTGEFIRVIDDKHILLPDRRGNNRLDSLRNIVGNPQVGLIFLVPNVGETIRIAGRAEILVDEELCASFAMQGKPASSVLSVAVDKIYFQCQKAIARSGIWDSETYIERDELPTVGEMLRVFKSDFDGAQYDKDYPERLKKTIY